MLEDANIKLGDVLSDVFCVSGKLMLAALLDGRMTAEQIANLAKKKAREKIPQLAASVADHRLSDHQRFLIRHALRHLEFLDEQVEALNTELRRHLTDSALAEAFHLLQSIPGIKEESAASILAEIGADMEQFPNSSATQFLGWLVSGEPRKRWRQKERSYEPGKHLAENNADAERMGSHQPKRITAAVALPRTEIELRKQTRHHGARTRAT